MQALGILHEVPHRRGVLNGPCAATRRCLIGTDAAESETQNRRYEENFSLANSMQRVTLHKFGVDGQL
jgi:hypothetical protein